MNFKKKITLIGSTGLIGSHLLNAITSSDYQIVKAITRRKIYNLENKNFIKQSVQDFSDLEKMRTLLKTDVLVNTLGTTIKKAGSKEEFMKIDHDLPLEISKIAKEEGCRKMILISSMGANSKSKLFYSRVKGLLEKSIEDIGFQEFHILRPSLLLGKRSESRPAEYITKLIMEPLSFLIPWNYKPIHAKIIGNTINCLIKENMPGKHIWEGRKLFEVQKFLIKENTSHR